ncbi:conserved hypothetical protein [Plasmopara halstedii]|uniref:Uncharacterized protein n=1 Tax=Plasmopara halstedii TaxID=4781 RepID=A0A0P1AYU1_PLAHL|nr:conserved hypothetical protein [Plasmopara halstedii]CEG47026.1 conserved hypothetical protein [Plasmopara halstedii]|eukprot:XP_024583395.1 conserved hypothetical protein [Plasmopara halstedii]
MDSYAQASTLQLLASHQVESQQPQDIEFTAQRIGFPISDAELKERTEQLDDDSIREESRAEATAKAERIMAVLRHSMSELEIGKVIHRIAQFATLPRVTGLSRKQFLRSLESRFGVNYAKEYAYMIAFLQGNDDVIDHLEIDSRRGAVDREDKNKRVTLEANANTDSPDDFVVPKIIGLHPDMVAEPTFVSIVFCYCRLACLNSLKLMQRPAAGFNRGSKSSLWQVKSDFRKVLDMEGFPHYADMLGLEKQTKDDDSGSIDAVDAEWEEFNLENDRIDFRMLLSQTQGIVDFMKTELSNETISKMLVAMLASVKTSKLHRKIFQEMVCNIQTAFPDAYHEQLLSELVPFLSGDNATYNDFDSTIATSALQHHQMRNEAMIRALLETRMRVGHILINDIDEVEPSELISRKLSPMQHEKVITTAWNIVSVLDDRKYHMFFTRFLKYKLAWRPNRSTFGETFLSDVRKTLGSRDSVTIMPMFEEVYQQLSVEMLTICRVKLRHSRRLLRGRGVLEPLNDAGRDRLEAVWQPSRCVFYRNLPHGVTKRHLEKALAHVGGVKRFFLFANPINGPPEAYYADDIDEKDEKNGETLAQDEIDEDPDNDDKKKVKKKRNRIKKIQEDQSLPKGKELRPLQMSKYKDKIIASDKKTPYQAVVEFESETACRKATMRALQIFGVMMAGWNEYRPVFSSPADERSGVTLMNVPYGATVGQVVDEVNCILEKAGLNMKVSGLVPRGVMLTNGRLDLKFPSFVEAAQVIDLLHDHVRKMKCRRPMSNRDAVRFNEFVKLKKNLHIKAKNKDKVRGKETMEQSERDEEGDVQDEENSLFLGVDDDEDEEEEDGAEEDESKKKKKRLVLEVSETVEEYFAEWLEAEAKMTEEEVALSELPRPFDVTWTPLPKPRNRHMYL